MTTKTQNTKSLHRVGNCLRFNVWTLFGVWCLVFGVFATRLSAQTPAAKPTPPNRYLLIVDTSFSMHNRARSVQAIAENLLQSGFNGEIQRGDTLGVWTFNEKLYTGRLPLQRWTPQAKQIIAANTLSFLGRQRYEKTTDLEPVLAEMSRVIANSDRITVILISDADEKIHGTPFDSEINSNYELNHRPLRQVRIPFTTVLRAEAGKITGYTVNTDLAPIKFPPLPTPPQTVELPKPASDQPKPPVPTAPPIIVSGKKVETNSTAKPTEPVTAQEKTPPAPADEIAKPRPAPTSQSTVTTIVLEKPVAVSTSNKEPVIVPPAAPTPVPAPVADTQTKSPVAAEVTKPTPPAAPPTPQAAPQTAVTQPRSNPTPATAPGQLATSIPSQNRRSIVWIIALALAAIVVVVVLLARRSRPSPRGSLITHSLDREKK